MRLVFILAALGQRLFNPGHLWRDVTAASLMKKRNPCLPQTSVTKLPIIPVRCCRDVLFTKYIEVLGLKFYAEANVADANVLHAAHILAELLDNDENGEVMIKPCGQSY